MGLTAFNRARRMADEKAAKAATGGDPPVPEEPHPATQPAPAPRKKKAGEP